MGTGMSLPKTDYTVGKYNRNVSNLYRVHNIQDHLLPYEVKQNRNKFGNINLAIELEIFNSIVTQKLGCPQHTNTLSPEQLEIYKSELDPSRVLQNVLTTNIEARDVKIEISPQDRQVYLCRNHLVELTEEIGKLRDITILQICCNYLKFLPYGIGQLKNLKLMIVSRNRIVEIPDEIGLCKELREMDLSFNLIRKLPRSMSGLKKLNTLQLVGNLIHHLPYHIGKLHSLKYLNLTNNPIRAIPLQIFKLPFLLNLICTGCPLSFGEGKFRMVGEPTLQEAIGRSIIRKNLPIRRSISLGLRNFFLDVQECCFCGGPFFHNYIEVEDTYIFESEEYPIFYKMCCRHYDRHEDRLSTLFEQTVSTFPAKIYEENLPSVCELFEPICFDDRQRKIMSDGFASNEATMPLISLAKYNTRGHRQSSGDGIPDDDCKNYKFLDDYQKSET